MSIHPFTAARRQQEGGGGPRLQISANMDIMGGKVVDLEQGRRDVKHEYGSALQHVLQAQANGAEWVHLVDLDAVFRQGDNRQLIEQIVRQLDISVELSGGLRDDESLDWALSTGCRRVHIGTAAIRNPDWTREIIKKHGDRIAVSLDVRGCTLAAEGWTKDGGSLWETLAWLDDAGCPRYVVANIYAEAMTAGPNFELLKDFCARTDRPVLARGGVGWIGDIRGLRALVPDGLEGAVIGAAFRRGILSLPHVLDVAGRP